MRYSSFAERPSTTTCLIRISAMLQGVHCNVLVPKFQHLIRWTEMHAQDSALHTYVAAATNSPFPAASENGRWDYVW